MAKDYYAILGVPKTANAEEIKKAFRKQALEHHPDRAGKASEERFKEVNEAYQILSDPKKRANYDQFGSATGPGGFGGGASGGFGIDLDDLFTGQGSRQGGFGFGFGGIGDIFESVMGEAMSQVQVEMAVKLTDLLLGNTLEFRAPSGDHLKLTIPAGTQAGTTFRFPGKGGSHRRGRGDLFISLRLELPRRLSKEQIRALEELRKAGL